MKASLIVSLGLIALAIVCAGAAFSWAVRTTPNYYSVAFFVAATITLLVLAVLVHRED